MDKYHCVNCSAAFRRKNTLAECPDCHRTWIYRRNDGSHYVRVYHAGVDRTKEVAQKTGLHFTGVAIALPFMYADRAEAADQLKKFLKEGAK